MLFANALTHGAGCSCCICLASPACGCQMTLQLLVPRLGYGWLRLGIYRFVRISAIPVSQTTGHWLDLIHKPCEPATTFVSQKYMNCGLNRFKPAQATRQLRGRTAFLVASKLQCCWSDSLDFSTRGLLYTLWIRFPFELTEDSG
jgi:hypothetical protein